MSEEFVNLCMKIHDMLTFCDVCEKSIAPSGDRMFISFPNCTAKVVYDDAILDFTGTCRMNIISATKGRHENARLGMYISSFVSGYSEEPFDIDHFDIMEDKLESKRYAALSLATLSELFGGIEISVGKLVAISESNARRSDKVLFHMKHNACN